jgi:hypothetical protein
MKVKEIYTELQEKMAIFKGDKFSKAHISELNELIDRLYEMAWKYEELE